MQAGDTVVVLHPQWDGTEATVIASGSTWVKVDLGFGLPRSFPIEQVKFLRHSAESSADHSAYLSAELDRGFGQGSIALKPEPVSVEVPGYAEHYAEKSEPEPPQKPRAKPPSKAWMHCRRYRSHGQMYYRFVWGSDRTQGWRHIPGGHAFMKLVRDRRDQVRAWIAAGESPEWIASQLLTWRDGDIDF